MLQSLVGIGITPGLHPRLAKRVRLTNQICVGFLVISVGMMTSTLLSHAWLFALTVLLFQLSMSAALLANHAHRYLASRLTVVAAPSLLGFFQCEALPVEARMNIGFFMMPMMPLILFELEERRAILFGVALPVVLYPISEWVRLPWVPRMEIPLPAQVAIHLSMAVGGLIFVEYIVYQFHVANTAAERRLEEANAHLMLEKQTSERLQRQLMDASRQAGMAEAVIGVLHNVGNVFNSLNVSAGLAREKALTLRISKIHSVSELLRPVEQPLSALLGGGHKGKQLVDYLESLHDGFERERHALLDDLGAISDGIGHIKRVIHLQQASSAAAMNIIESLDVADVIEDALRFECDALSGHSVELERQFSRGLCVRSDRHRLIQILLNLIGNARDAMSGARRVLVIAARETDDRVEISVQDSGVGIAAEDLTRIFSFGFSTKKDGHGFGLHRSALIAGELGGSLTCESAGAERGATFIVTLPRALAAAA